MDYEFIFATLFDIDVKAAQDTADESSRMQIDILKYDLALRKVFYKFYPAMLSKYPRLEKIFSAKDLERALIADADLVCIPIELIDPKVIQTKLFDKLLSQDYNIIHDYVQFKTDHPEDNPIHLAKRIKYEIHYNNIFVSELSMTINNNLEFFATIIGGHWIIEVVPNALDTLSDKFIIEYLNSNEHKSIARAARNCIIITRYFHDNGYPDELWDSLTDNGKRNLLSIHLEQPSFKGVLPNNSIATLPATTSFIELLTHRKALLTGDLIKFFEFNITSDTYTGDWVVLNPADVSYKHVTVDDVTCKLNTDGIKMQLQFVQEKSIGYQVANYVNSKYDSKDMHLTSTIILEEALQYFPLTVKMFDCHDSSIRAMLISKCPMDYLPAAFNNELTIHEGFRILNKIITDTSYQERSYLAMFKLDDAGTINAIILATNTSEMFDKFITAHLNMFLPKRGSSPTQLTDSFIEYYIAKVTLDAQLFDLIRSINVTDEILHKIFQSHHSFVYSYLDSKLLSKEYDAKQFSSLITTYYKSPCTETYNLGIRFIMQYHEEPMLRGAFSGETEVLLMYPPPNFVATFQSLNAARAWETYVNRHTVPKEMTNTSFYEYMVKCNGVKKNPEFTSCYSFFSNSLENKIIFVKADVILSLPAVIRFDIPVEYDLVKNYLLEGIETNNITMFTTVTDNDWSKISGGNNMLDCIALSDSKNIYRERTPLREVISYLIKAIEIEFDIKAIVPEAA